MDPLEENLRRVFRQPEPSAGLAARVLARTTGPAKRRLHWVRTAAAVGLIGVIGVVGWHYQRVRKDRLEGEHARDQLIEAFRLAGEQLRPFQQRMDEIESITISIPEGEN
jgi:hypothetical protein